MPAENITLVNMLGICMPAGNIPLKNMLGLYQQEIFLSYTLRHMSAGNIPLMNTFRNMPAGSILVKIWKCSLLTTLWMVWTDSKRKIDLGILLLFVYPSKSP
jgi:hypothetical protein